jgi:hypothetical protein
MPTPRKLAGPLAVAAAVASLGAPAALAQPADHVATPPQRPMQDLRWPDTRDAAEGRSTASQPAPAVGARPLVEVAHADGFDWTDAAIGAGGAAGLFAISLAGAATFRRSEPAAR